MNRQTMTHALALEVVRRGRTFRQVIVIERAYLEPLTPGGTTYAAIVRLEEEEARRISPAFAAQFAVQDREEGA